MGQLASDQQAEQRLDPAESAQQQPAEATSQPQEGGRRPAWTGADTQAAQQNAEIKRLLGLPKSASVSTVQRALDELRDNASAPPPDFENLDPYVAERLENADAQVYSMAGMSYGDEVRDAAWDLYSSSGSTAGFGTFFEAYITAVERSTEETGATPEGEYDEQYDENYAYDEQSQPNSMPSLGEGDIPVGTTQNPNADPTGGRRDSGDFVGWVRAQAQRLGIEPR